MALSSVNVKERKSGGKGGLFAKIGGGLLSAVGAAAAPFTGGATTPLVGIGAGIATAGALGDPVKRSQSGSSPLSSVSKLDPGVQLAQLVDTQKQINSSGELDENQKTEFSGIVSPAIEALKRRRV